VVEAPVADEGLLTSAPPGAVFDPTLRDLTSTIRFDRPTGEDGRSQNVVLAIAQDRRRFRWFSTEDGLHKYEGHEFAIYKHEPDDAGTLSDDCVSVIYEDREGVLWVRTRNGPNRLDRSTRTFVWYEHGPVDVHATSDLTDHACAGQPDRT
jgi:hypothetical protein